jgi:hypothetical protein
VLDKGLFRSVAGSAGELGGLVFQACVDGWQVAGETARMTHQRAVDEETAEAMAFGGPRAFRK